MADVGGNPKHRASWTHFMRSWHLALLKERGKSGKMGRKEDIIFAFNQGKNNDSENVIARYFTSLLCQKVTNQKWQSNISIRKK